MDNYSGGESKVVFIQLCVCGSRVCRCRRASVDSASTGCVCHHHGAVLVY